LGNLAACYIAEHVSIQRSLQFGGAICLVGAVAFLLFLARPLWTHVRLHLAEIAKKHEMKSTIPASGNDKRKDVDAAAGIEYDEGYTTAG
jgi:hypothetical protein